MRDNLHFAHGNGFPSSCYRQLFEVLGTRFNCGYIDKVGHNPAFPVTENWDNLVDELIVSIETKFSQPVIGLGHSLGGILNLLASIKKPALFKSVIMIDSPLLGRFKSGMIRIAKSVGMIDKLTPAARAKRRMHHWHSEEELTTYLESRPLFQTFSEQCLKDYLNFGFNKTKEGYRLSFDKSVEYLIFRTIPHHLPSFEGKLTVPTALIHGDKSHVVDQFDVRYMRKKYQVNCYLMNGTHMLPMESPEALGLQIFKAIDDLSP